MSYMKWVVMIREEANRQLATGLHLGALSARAKIPEYRLREWLKKNTIDDLNYTELRSLHEVLTDDPATNIVLESPQVAESGGKIEPSTTASTRGYNSREHDGPENAQLSFDESD